MRRTKNKKSLNLGLPENNAMPKESEALLEQAKKKFGFIPNVLKGFSSSPAVLEAYLNLEDLVSKTSFTVREQQAAALILSWYHDCKYCLAAHGTIGQSAGLDKETVVALQLGADLDDERLEGLTFAVISATKI